MGCTNPITTSVPLPAGLVTHPHSLLLSPAFTEPTVTCPNASAAGYTTGTSAPVMPPGVAGLAEDDVEGAVVEVGEVGGEALGGTEVRLHLFDGLLVSGERLRPRTVSGAHSKMQNTIVPGWWSRSLA